MEQAKRFESALRNLSAAALASSELPRSLMMSQSGNVEVFYAPFDYVNPNARLVLVGITPGVQQAMNAIRSCHRELADGANLATALRKAKGDGSFSGALRGNLIRLLDSLGVQHWLEIPSCASLFDTHMDLVHFTSALKYPVLVDGTNYSGRQPAMTRDSRLLAELERWLPEELAQLERPLIVPLGDSVAGAIDHLANRGSIDAQQVLRGLPHPSGANAERIAYFIGSKPRAKLSVKVDPDKLDAAREQALRAIAKLLQGRFVSRGIEMPQ
ncbi:MULTISPECIES: hypothetical protein [unclassified Ectothiorhodospira]|uniref:uracil-DNA glycosylase family protein n=1 Tax=unclassified Ectothiorhodospira TaxID=2684909 RepID=UPI001EE835B9|nr:MULTISPECIES: hypothetical protein [unclassified Ectothiorhodospira]MCG5516809.1 hypothetical protein [Ectothiorhodospira sp. 9100]MCG5519773.1 hypothetical protein [Ectothiorhodospira sp. 9905]